MTFFATSVDEFVRGFRADGVGDRVLPAARPWCRTVADGGYALDVRRQRVAGVSLLDQHILATGRADLERHALNTERLGQVVACSEEIPHRVHRVAVGRVELHLAHR